MFNNDFTRPNSRRVHKYPFASVVILHKESTGIVHACPTSNVNMIGSRTYSVKSAIKPEYWFGTLNVQSDLQDSSKREYCKLGQRGEEPSMSVLMTGVSSTKKLNKVLGILLTAGGILLITKHKRLIGLATSLGGLLLSAMTVSKK